MNIKFQMTWGRYSRLAAFTAGVALASTPFSFMSCLETGEPWFIWQGVFTLSTFWVMVYLSHRWAKKGGKSA